LVTIFAIPKPFVGHTGLIQRNAITSWTALRPRPEIILFGDDAGTAEICRDLELIHVPELARTQFGAPLLPDLFEKAQRLATNCLLSYVNADVILMSDFIRSLSFARTAGEKFLMVARVWRLRIDDTWDFHALDAEQKLRTYVTEHGRQGPPPGNSDFFAFPRGMWSDIPQFGVGRGWWDPWLIYEARRLGASVVDASPFVMAVHQNHDQSSYPHGLKRWRQEINHNYDLAGKEAASFCLYDATHIANNSGLRRARGLRYLSRYIDTLPVLHPILAWPMRVPKAAINGVRGFRQSAALARNSGLRLVKLVQSKLPSDGVTAILGLKEAATGNGEFGTGINLARALAMGGYPVVAYDPEPSVMERARRTVPGPVEFVQSAEVCAKQADVVVVASRREEFRSTPAWVPSEKEQRRVVIDCCGLWQRETMRPEIEYIAWAAE